MKLYPKNWGDFQHYKDRMPPWIRLHKHLLDDYEFHCLPVASRALAPMLWLLASESKNMKTGEIDADPKKLAFRLRMSEEELLDAIKPLIEHGFFSPDEPASKALADCEHGAVPEAEAEAEAEADIDPNGSSSGTPDCPHDEIIKIYHDCCPTMPRVREWNDTRKKQLRARWRDKEKRQNLDWWKDFFDYCNQSDFLRGDKSDFVADLEWLTKAGNFAKVIEGKYENRGAA